MQHSARIQAVIELLSAFQAAETPADVVMGSYFRQRKYIGSKDKRFIAEFFYQVLRRYFELEWAIYESIPASKPPVAWESNSWDTPRLLTGAALIMFDKSTSAEVADIFSGERFSPSRLEIEEQKILKKIEKVSPPETVKLNFPFWLEEKLKEQFAENFTQEINALNQQAPLDLRVNTLKTNPSKAIMLLMEEGITASPAPNAPYGLRIAERTPVFTTKTFKDGMIEVQDEGSQLVSLMADAKPGQTVVDFCAGAGGKTLSLAAQMKNKGRIYAFDVSQRRLEECEKRLRRGGVHNATVKYIESENDKYLKRIQGMADVVLVDAPCSGSGTWRRSPDLKLRLTPEKLAKLVLLQSSIMTAAAKLVKSGGKLLYITCSVLADENEKQVEKFLQRNKEFSVLQTSKLTPFRNGTDGFFCAILTKAGKSPDQEKQ